MGTRSGEVEALSDETEEAAVVVSDGDQVGSPTPASRVEQLQAQALLRKPVLDPLRPLDDGHPVRCQELIGSIGEVGLLATLHPCVEVRERETPPSWSCMSM